MTAAEEEPRTPFREWPAAGRWAVYLVAALVIALIAGALATLALVRRSFPETAGEVELPRLAAPAEISRGSSGIPVITATEDRDLFLAQGYAQAQDRFFAMDVARRRASGRLAELLGPSALESDQVARTLGWRRLAEAEFEGLTATSKAYLRAFSAGVNAYLRSRSPSQLALEYTLLALAGPDYKPAEWTPADSLAILKAETSTYADDTAVEVARARLGLDRDSAEVDALYPDPSPFAETASFAIAGDRTVSGAPLLAAAPTGGPGLPSPWIQVTLRCEPVDGGCPYQLSGVTLAGVPGVLVGRNAEVAWGWSRSGVDTADLVLERISGARYQRGRRMVELEQRDESIRIAGAESKVITVRSTDVGPLLSDVSGEISSVGANAAVPAGSPPRGNGYAVALAAASLAPARTADALFALGRATGLDEVEAAAGDLALPGWKLVMAASDAATGGHIGSIELGPRPRRGRGADGLDAAAGWAGAGWIRTLPAAPAIVDPVGGIVGAGPRASATVAGSRQWSAARLSVVQADTVNPIAPALVPALLRIVPTSAYQAEGQRLLIDWDFRQRAPSAAAAYFNVVWANVLRLTFHDQLRESLWPDGGPRWMAVVARLLEEPDDPWWDDVDTTAVVEDRDAILAAAQRAARDELTRLLARDPAEWSWGALHGLPQDDAALLPRDLGPLSALVDRGPQPIGGGPGTAYGGAYDAAAGFEATSAPGARLIADLGEPDESLWVSRSGASGHAFAAHFGDQRHLWVGGGLVAWPMAPSPDRLGRARVLRLAPGLGDTP